MKRYVHVLDRDPDFEGLKPSLGAAKEIMLMSHRLAFSSFAPPGKTFIDADGTIVSLQALRWEIS